MSKRPKMWSEDEVSLLIEKFPTSSKQELLILFPDRTYKSICGKAEKMKLNKGLIDKWSKEDDELLIEYYESISKETALELFPNRTWVGIQSRASSLGLRKYQKHKDSYEKWTDEKLNEYSQSRGYTFIRKFKDLEANRFRVEVVCENGHRSTPPIGSFVKGNECRKCIGTAKLSTEEIQPEIESRGYRLMSEYIDCMSELILECPKGHKWYTSWNVFSRGANCFTCFHKTIGERSRLDYDFVKSVFESHDCILISETYTSHSEKLEFICNKHKEKGVQRRSYNSFTHPKIEEDYGCKFCGIERRSKKQMLDYNLVVKCLESRNFTIVTAEDDYNGSVEDIGFICNKHKEKGVQVKPYHWISNQKYGCNFCWLENNSRENHYRWNGGISTLTQHLRGKIEDWKKDSIKASRYKCMLSGERKNLVVHHIYSFSSIVQETMKELMIDIRGSIGDYSKEELDLIESKCNEIHYKYGLGACIHRDIHDLFHSIYTNYDFTPDDFEEFVFRYNNGEFKEAI